MQLTDREFSELVEQALDEVPEAFEPYLENIAVDIELMPDAETCARVGLSDPRSLLGLYHGTPITERHAEGAYWNQRIVIYKSNIERICRTRAQVVRQIRKTVLHEVGHHFGLDEDDLHQLGYG